MTFTFVSRLAVEDRDAHDIGVEGSAGGEFIRSWNHGMVSEWQLI